MQRCIVELGSSDVRVCTLGGRVTVTVTVTVVVAVAVTLRLRLRYEVRITV